MSRVRRSLAMSLSSRQITLVLQFIGVVIVSRLLTPAEVGIFSVAASVAGLLTVLRMFGVPDFIIAAKELTPRTLRACFTVAMLISGSLALVLLALRGPASTFYGNPGIGAVFEVSVFGFLIMPLGIVSFARMRRRMEYGRIAVIQVSSVVVSSVTTVALAFQGLSYMSMAWGNLAGNVAMTLAILAYTRREFLFMPTLSGLWPVLRFGGLSSLTSIVTEIGAAAPSLIIGRVLSLDAVAYFSRASSLSSLMRRSTMSSVGAVAQSWFAEGNRAAPDVLRRDFLRATAMLSGLSWPFYTAMILAAREVTLVLFGPQWLPSVPVAQILCFGACLGAVNVGASPLLKGMGRVGSLLRMTLVVQGLRVIAVAIGATISLEAVAACLVIAQLGGSMNSQWIIRRTLGLGVRDYVRNHWRSAAATGVMLGPVGLVVLAGRTYDLSPFVVVGILAVVAPLALALGYRLTGHGLWDETKRAVGALLRRIRP